MTVQLKKKKTEHYVDNKKFLEEMKKYRKKVLSARNRNHRDPKINDYIGECFLKIAEGLSHKGNFVRYTYREEMVMDAVENCLKAIENYNLEVATRTGKPNAFAYFTQIAWYAFLRRIQKEKKQTVIKQRMIAEANYDDMTLQPGEDREFRNQFTEFLQRNLPLEEDKLPTKKKKKAKKK